MKAEKFSESMNNINDKYIEEAVNYQARPASAGKKKKSSGMKVWRVIAIVACALLAVGIGVTAIGVTSMKNGGVSKTAEHEMVPDESPAEGGASFPGMIIGNGAGAGAGEYYSEDYALAGSEPSEVGKEMTGGSEGRAADSSKIIYTANLNISTKDFEDSNERIETVTKKHNGFFENMELNNGSSSYRSAYYVVRIPAEELDGFLKDAEEFGTITSLTKGGSDVSESYYDIESRLDTAKKKLKRLQKLLDQAADMSDIITIEESISDVEWEIDDLTGMLKNYDSDVKYSTVTINLNEVYKIENDDAPLSFGERLSQGFKNGLDSFATAMGDVLVWLASYWMWVLLIAAIIVVIIVVVVKVEKKTNPKK